MGWGSSTVAHAVFLGLGRMRQEVRGQPVLHSETLSQKAKVRMGLGPRICDPSAWAAD